MRVSIQTEVTLIRRYLDVISHKIFHITHFESFISEFISGLREHVRLRVNEIDLLFLIFLIYRKFRNT